MKRLLVASVAAVVLATGAGLATAAAPAASTGSADARFKAIYSTEWHWREVQFGRIDEAGGEGEGTMPDHLPAIDAKTQAARLAYWNDVLKKLDAIKLDALSPDEQVNYEVYRTQVGNLAADQRFRLWEMPFNSDSSFWAELSPGRESFRTAAAYRAYIGQLNDMRRYFRDEMTNMRAGLARGFSVPREAIEGRDKSIADVFADPDPTHNAFYEPFKTMPASISTADQAAIRDEALKAITTSVIPAHQELYKFMQNEYWPKTRRTLAAEAMPDGAAFYQQQIHEYTTLDLTPDQIHQIGLNEVARIHVEMLDAMKATGFTGTFPEFLTYLRTDPKFYAKTPQELLADAALIAKRGDGKLSQYFGLLPRGRFTIVPVPDNIAPFYTSGRGGAHVYLLNTYDLPHRPLYQLTALTLHEAELGHSLQLSLAEEQKAQPAFRRHSYISAYGEGWALYTEKLGKEMGLYQTPYDDFGRLSWEMWRACRLVVDTGIHHKGWTRAQAIKYMSDNTALPEHEIETEVDRYITWPAQALSYKLGEIDIERLRAKAEKELGPKFDIRAFHDTVLSMGSVPLPVLDRRIDQFIAAGGKDPVVTLH
ncbi:MAG TPA: DUF885 family protein [Caulobacteraceae bacterium]